jgi:hypothetical protein
MLTLASLEKGRRPAAIRNGASNTDEKLRGSVALITTLHRAGALFDNFVTGNTAHFSRSIGSA